MYNQCERHELRKENIKNITRIFLFSCPLTSHRELVFTLSLTMEQRGWETASLEFKGSLFGICTVKEELIEYG